MVRMPVYCGFFSRTSERKPEHAALSRAGEVAGPRQAEMKLGGALDLGVEARCDGTRGSGQTVDGGLDVLAAILIVPPADEDGRQQARPPAPATIGERGYSRETHPWFG